MFSSIDLAGAAGQCVGSQASRCLTSRNEVFNCSFVNAGSKKGRFSPLFVVFLFVVAV